MIDKINYPLAVRSSSILEDSQMLPFAGLYSTYILPNNHPEPEIRFQQLLDAIRLVYASVFYQSPKQYVKNTDLRIEEEKMAVLIQQLIGESHGDIFYPAISGVAQSYNFYPISYMKPEQGIVSLALGFGKTIVEGEQVYRFSPAYPKMNPPFSSPGEFLKESQAKFYALNLNDSLIHLTADDSCTYETFDLGRAEQDGTLTSVASTYSYDDDLIRDTMCLQGPRVVTFAPILKYELFPLAKLINDFFTLGRQAFSTHVEIEFAINLPKDNTKAIEFYFLQIRPMVVGRELSEVKIDAHTKNEILCKSRFTMGNGIFTDIYDFIYIDPDRFALNQTEKIAREIGDLNRQLRQESRKCIILGFGRFGTSDPWLGIPLEWSEMSQAKVVIEANSEKLRVDPSLGSHFFHNLISLKMGYFHISRPESSGKADGTGFTDEAEFIDWEWLRGIPAFRRTESVKHLRFDKPLVVKIDGRNGNGVILKPR